MAESLRLAWSIATTMWRATWNQTIRFSKLKIGLIWIVIQALFFLFISRRTPMLNIDPRQGILGLAVLIGLQMAWFGLMNGFTSGQMQLYRGILVPLFQITPIRPIGVILGRALQSVPSRMLACLLWGWVYSGALPGASRPLVALLLAGVGLLSGMLAHLAGLLILTVWGRYSPKTMRNGATLLGIGSLGLVTWIVIYLASGGTVSALSTTMREYRQSVMGLLVLLAGLPGLILFLASLLAPAWIERLYRAGLYQVIELNEQDVSRSARSFWLPLRHPIYRAVLSREWLQLSRSKVFRIQLVTFAAGAVGTWFAGRSMAGRPATDIVLYVGGLALFAWFMGFGEWVVRVFDNERKTIFLYRVTGTPVRHLIIAKLISLFGPSVILVTLSTLAGALAAHLGVGPALGVGAWAAAGMLAAILGGFGAAAATASEAPEEETGGQTTPDGTPMGNTNAWYSIFRIVALILCMALPIAIGAGLPGVPFAVPGFVQALVGIGLPMLLLLFGVRLMVRRWERVG
ncbi:MAG TPA: hypothetical protein VK191_09795 [Symbiobacteriaceae bacterium]|nr:hypothetical protein [Symbiobacteriaceae bacterium]